MPFEFNYSWGEIRGGLDRTMLVTVLVLFALGLASIYSAGIGVRTSTVVYVVKQLTWGAVSAVVYVFVLRAGYQDFVRYSYWMYGGTVALLVVLSMSGTISKGAVRWFQLGALNFQPAEMGKVVLILAMSRFCSRNTPNSLKNLFMALAVFGVSVVLILLQPDLGSSLVYVAVMFAMLAVAGAPGRYLGGMVLAGLAAAPFLWGTLRSYQKLRLVVFLDPYVDPQGAGYNVIQSRIAVGSGGLWGKGFLHGTQGRLHFLPEPHTDFIFSVFAEEFGFVGGVIVVALFACLLWRVVRAAFQTKDVRGKLFCIGVAAWLWFQVMESIAMSMGLAPITGLPLPLFSYGGSSLLMTALALALVQSVAISPVKDRFSTLT
ncbi:MAG: rod shape-determining protein RodA [Synergistaceae bacterium]|jgi:rod shape determining protein RodA|nr:rod shape-determining protein RodA [Synergistaceae bacterium]